MEEKIQNFKIDNKQLKEVVGGADEIPEGAPQPKYEIGQKVYVIDIGFSYGNKVKMKVLNRSYISSSGSWDYTLDTGFGYRTIAERDILGIVPE